jgi:two-component system, NtrC family, response regulator HydG
MKKTPAKILVVDDDPGTLDTLGDVLTATGYETSMVSSGHAAIAKAKVTRFDLILMDVQMPGLNGVQTLRALRALDPHVSVIMMTAYTQDELVAESQRTTGFEVFSKPLELDRVLPLVKRIVTSRPSGPSTAT